MSSSPPAAAAVEFGPVVQEHQPVQPNQQPNRDDISPGMVLLPSEPILDVPELFGPLICFAFHTKEEASVPKALQDVLWVIHSAMCLVHRGEKKAFLDLKGRPFRVLFTGVNSEKPIILSAEEHTVCSEIQIQIRVHSMPPEHYTVLVVRTHAAFSLRHAIVHLLTQNLIQQTNERRKVLNMHARRVREHLGCSLFSEFERGESIDWLRVPNTFSFHTLFSVLGAVEWIRSHYQRMHPEAETFPPLEGFGHLDPPAGTFVDAQFIHQCMTYEKNLDEIVKASHDGKSAGGKSTARAKRPGEQSKHPRTNNAVPASPASASSKANTEAEETEVETDTRGSEKRDALLSMMELSQPDGWILDEVGGGPFFCFSTRFEA